MNTTDTADNHTRLSDAEACLRAGIAIGANDLREVQGVPTLLVPANYTVHQFEDFLPAPVHTDQVVICETAKSFIDYFNHFANDNSAVFCDTSAEKFTGVIDYHSAGKAAWCKHSVIYTCQRTHEASAWLANNGKKMEQEEFAVFIEDNALEVVNPPGATMLEIATNLKAQKKVQFISGTVLSTSPSTNTMARPHEHKRLERIMGTRTAEEFLDWISGASIYIGRARYGQLGGHGFVCVSIYEEDDILQSWVNDLNGGDHEALSAAQNITKMNCWLGNDRDPAKAMHKMLNMARQYYYYELNDGKT